MPKLPWLYAIGITLTGSGLLIGAIARWPLVFIPVFLPTMALALLGATLKVRLPGLDGTISPSCIPILFAACTMSWQETVVIATMAGVMQCTWRPRNRPKLLQVTFNGSVLSLAAVMAHFVAHAVAGPSLLVLFAVAAVVFQFINSMTVATILCLLERISLTGTWRKCHFWSFPYQLAGGGIAFVGAHVRTETSLFITVIGALTLYLMASFYQEFITQAQARAA